MGRVLLPTSVKAEDYEVRLVPDLQAFRFTGSSVTRVQVQTVVHELTFHARDLTVETLRVEVGGQEVAHMTSQTVNEKDEMVTATLSGALPAGPAELHMTFRGELNDQMAGFYRSKYQLNGETKYMATTQFEPTDARRAFPCWDEPALKATFRISLEVPAGLQALGNMPEESRSAVEGSDRTLVTFARTPVMSTYLIAFVVGEFDVVEGKTAEGVTVRVFTPPGKGSQGEFALHMATRTLSYFGQYYGLQYPLPKLDMVAIPDFSAGAMENWGLVTYRETALLIDEQTSPVSQKQRVAYVVAHELAHQWFGNLVTMQWWKELWLNEGFATFVGNQAVAHFYPQWDIWTQFVSQYSGRALDLDALQSSHPIEVEVSSSAEVNEIFDLISYCKGASVIRMLFNVLGEANFQKGLHIYLTRHAYANAVTEDLWNAFSEASGRDIRTFMDHWTKKTGFPVLHVQRTGDSLHVRQTRFLANGKTLADDQTEENPTWHVPLNVLSSSCPDTPHLRVLDSKEAPALTSDALLRDSSWYTVNAHATNFVRVSYDAASLAKLGEALAAGQLSATDRLSLQSDVFALASAGKASTAEALRLALRYTDETDYTVWTDLLGNLKSVATVWSGEAASAPLLRALLVQLTDKAVAHLGWEAKEGEGDMAALTRGALLGAAGLAGNQAVVAEAKRRFARFCEHDTAAIPADLRQAVFRMVVRHGDVSDFERMLKLYRESDMHEEKIRCLGALSSSTDEALIERALALGLSDEVRPQDSFYVVAFVGASKVGREKTWQFVKLHWPEYVARFGDGQFLLARIVQYAISDFASVEMAEDVEQFFRANPCPPAERTILQGLERIRAQADWLNRDRVEVNALLHSLFP